MQFSLRRALTVVALLALLAGCAGGPRPIAAPPARSAAPDRDGPGDSPPPNLQQIPDAEPRVEPVRPGGPNKPYELMGRQYVPLQGDPPFTERGLASWYGRKFHGKPTASGEPYDMYAMTAAHPTLPIPSYVRVRNPANGREVIVRVNDRGPFHSDRIIDLSYTAALKLDLLRGVRPVEIERITYDDIRTGAWRHDAGATTMLAGADAAALPEPAASSPGEPAAAPASAPSADARGFWIQLGAFRQSVGAVEFQRKVERELADLTPLLAIFSERDVHRLQAGPYRSRADAQGAAERIRAALQLVPVIVEKR
jgi:rare lipoprotein A